MKLASIHSTSFPARHLVSTDAGCDQRRRLPEANKLSELTEILSRRREDAFVARAGDAAQPHPAEVKVAFQMGNSISTLRRARADFLNASVPASAATCWRICS